MLIERKTITRVVFAKKKKKINETKRNGRKTFNILLLYYIL